MPDTVLFLPGIKGSVLKEGRKVRWPSVNVHDLERLSLRDGSHELVAADVVRKMVKGFGNVYHPILVDIEAAGHRLEIFPYDWRYSLFHSLDDLDRRITDLAERYGEPVTLVCHSMGNLLAKLYLVSRRPDLVKQVVSLAAPWRGAPEAYEVLRYGSLFPGSRITFSLAQLFTALQVATPTMYAGLGQECPSVYQLLPSPSYFELCGEEGYIGNPDGSNASSYEAAASVIDANAEFGLAMFTTHVRNLHGELAKPWPAGIPNFNVIGYGHSTIGQLIDEPDYYLKRYPDYHALYRKARAKFITGDGTVPVISALPDHISPGAIRYVKEAHPYVPRNRAVRQWVLNILAGNWHQAVAGLSDIFDQQLSLNQDLVMVSCPVDVRLEFDLPEAEGDLMQSALAVLSDVPPGVTVHDLGETRYLAVPPGIQHEITMDAFASGPLNVSVTRYEAGSAVRSAQFHEVDVTPRTSAKLVLRGNGSAELEVIEDNQDQAMILAPVVTEDAADLADRTPPGVRILVEPLGGGQPIGRVGHGHFQVRISAQDTEAGILEIFFRVNGGTWQRYPDRPVPLEVWGQVTIEAYATDKVRNRTPELARKRVKLFDPENGFIWAVDYSSGRIRAQIKTLDGLQPDPETPIEVSVNGGAPWLYEGYPIDVPYGAGDVQITYRVRAFDQADGFQPRTLLIRCAGVQPLLWANGDPLRADAVGRHLCPIPGAPVAVFLDGRAIGMDFNVHSDKTAESLVLQYPGITYQVLLKPTYECYIQGDEIVRQGETLHVRFALYDNERPVDYPDLMVSLHAKRRRRFELVRTLMPDRANGLYQFTVNPAEEFPFGVNLIKFEVHDYRHMLRERVIRLSDL